LAKLFQFFEEKELDLNAQSANISNSNLFNAFFKNLDNMFQSQIKNENDDFFTHFFITNFTKIEIQVKNIQDWRLCEYFIKAIQKFETVEYFSNHAKSDEIFTKLIQILKFFLHDKKGNNFIVQVECLIGLARILKFSQNQRRQGLLKYIEDEYANNKSFYKRRLYFKFIEECFEIFSIKYAKYFGLLDGLYQLLDDNNLIKCNVLSVLSKIYPLISTDGGERFVKKISEIKEKENCKLIKERDTELEKVNFFLILNRV
jgi:hypothetical protein